MAKDAVLYGYALLDDTKYVVNIDEINRPFTKLHKFHCPHCHNVMYATFGKTKLPHFRHNRGKCEHSKYLHDLAEDVFYEEYSKCLDNRWPFFLELRVPIPCNGACVLQKHANCKEHYIQKTLDLTAEYKLISLEPKVEFDDHYRRPDILLESLDGRQLWVEIWVSHETEKDKRKDGCIIEIKVDSEKDLEKIQQHRLVQSEGEDYAVRIFSIDKDSEKGLFKAEEPISKIEYPCEKYYCFEVGKNRVKPEIINGVRRTECDGLSYRLVMRLNWIGAHNNMDGDRGKKVTERDLQDVCLQRCFSDSLDVHISRDKSLESLIVYEWKSDTFYHKPIYQHHNSPRAAKYASHRLATQTSPSYIDSSSIEWVDLGLPSGTLWAKEDLDVKTTFLDSRKYYGDMVPSKRDAIELRDFCTKKWDTSAHSLVLTGPNGNSISFYCKNRYQTYWLSEYEQGDTEFGQCFHIGSDQGFWINDADSNKVCSIRLRKCLPNVN